MAKYYHRDETSEVVIHCTLEWHYRRGVLYIHGPDGRTILRVCCLPSDLSGPDNPSLLEGQIDITHMRGASFPFPLKGEGWTNMEIPRYLGDIVGPAICAESEAAAFLLGLDLAAGSLEHTTRNQLALALIESACKLRCVNQGSPKIERRKDA